VQQRGCIQRVGVCDNQQLQERGHAEIEIYGRLASAMLGGKLGESSAGNTEEGSVSYRSEGSASKRSEGSASNVRGH
jgi:hypothetical protein